MLLDFTVENYRCFAEEATLDLTRESLRTLTPRSGSTWQEQTWRVAAVFGANASGKSTLLDALDCLHRAVGGQRDILHQPFALDDEQRTRPSRFAISFTHEGERYSYSVEAHRWGIAREELWAAGPRWRKVFVRAQAEGEDTPVIEAGASLRGATHEVSRITTIKDLFLAVALRYKHATLAPVARSLRSLRFIHHSDMERSARLQWVMSRLAENPENWKELCDTIVQAADVGITAVEIEKRDLPPRLLEQLRRAVQRDTEEDETIEIPEDILSAAQRSLVFSHRGIDGHTHRLSLGVQSQGTRTANADRKSVV